MSEAIRVIKAEHRSIAAVLDGMLFLVGEIRKGRMRPDFELFKAMLHYIRAFPVKLHHPKEDQWLYRILRERRADAAQALDELETEHVQDRELVAGLADALDRYEKFGREAFDAFDNAVKDYAKFEWSHMRKEEEVILPMAEQALSADDWKAIDAAFRSNEDPIVGVRVTREFRELFKRIVNLAPPPIGVGPEQRG